MSVDLDMFDITTITAQLRAVRPDCGWLMLAEGRQKISDCDFVSAAELLRRGTLLHPLRDI